MHQAYCNVFTRLGLNFRPVQADTGSIGGTGSHEFHVLAESGEDDIAFSDSSDYAANVEKAEAIPRETARGAAERGDCAWSTRRMPRPSPIWSSSSACPSRRPSRPWWCTAPRKATWWPCWCAATTS